MKFLLASIAVLVIYLGAIVAFMFAFRVKKIGPSKEPGESTGGTPGGRENHLPLD